nr:histidine kinase [Sphingomonas naasensis]
MTVRESERRLVEARHATQQAQLAALRFQLNPHFLFNTLNAISSLIVTRRNEEAERMTMKLSEFLRLSLEADPDAEVMLDEELGNTQSYLEIEAVRFGDRLKTEFECPAELLGAWVPSFLLQPLVENSVKYAVAPSRKPVLLSVRASAAQGTLRLVVEDSGRQGVGLAPATGTGLGLDNVRKRLAAFYGAQASVEAQAKGRGFAVQLALPLRYARMQQAAE